LPPFNEENQVFSALFSASKTSFVLQDAINQAITKIPKFCYLSTAMRLFANSLLSRLHLYEYFKLF
jgi:hypothetical protein